MRCRKTQQYMLIALSVMLSNLTLAGWKTPRESLNNRLVFAPYKVYFAVGGPHSIIGKKDLTQDEEQKLSLRLERLKRQIRNADQVYQQALNLTPPLSSRRYSDVEGIHMHIMDLGKTNGTAGDAPNRFRYRFFNDRERVLITALTPRWQPPNLTPAHEVFHLYQYGYTFFKNGWFLEGLAVSAQNHFGLKRWKTQALPKDVRALEKLMKRRYSAGPFWSQLSVLCDPGCQKGPTPCGRSLVSPLLEQMAREDLIAARDRKLNPEDWPEKEQKSPANQPYILSALRKTLLTHCPVEQSPELRAFTQLLGRYLQS